MLRGVGHRGSWGNEAGAIRVLRLRSLVKLPSTHRPQFSLLPWLFVPYGIFSSTFLSTMKFCVCARGVIFTLQLIGVVQWGSLCSMGVDRWTHKLLGRVGIIGRTCGAYGNNGDT